MKLETRLKRLATRLPIRQQTLEFVGDDLWRELSQVDRDACQSAIAELLLQVLRAEARHETNTSVEERNEHE